jgi:exodeoxyribonuclease V alpha subunit
MIPVPPFSAREKTGAARTAAEGLDLHFGRFLTRLSKHEDDSVSRAAALLCKAMREGHVCLDLSTASGAAAHQDDGSTAMRLPRPDEWIGALKQSPVVGGPGDFRPLILHGNRLYTQRYWQYEQQVVQAIHSRLDAGFPLDNTMLSSALLESVFPPGGSREIDWQKLAALAALSNAFTVISGGPGTGKTATVARILVLLAWISPAGLRIALAAPTGKAADRLKKAVRDALGSLSCPPGVAAAMPAEAYTLHRLLGVQPLPPYFRFSKDNPLPFDVIVVDEASMVDCSLMARLLTAAPAGCRVILLGDKDQLASVEAGAVLGDICDTGKVHSMTPAFCGKIGPYLPEVTGMADPSEKNLGDCIVQLKKNFRFASDSGIARLSRSVNAGEDGAAMALFTESSLCDIAWRDMPAPRALSAALSGWVLGPCREFLGQTDLQAALARFESFRVLCAVRNGPYGVGSVNAIIERILEGAELIANDSPWYAGRPVMVTVNDYSLGLYNGDVGIIMPDPDNPRRRAACFAAQQPGAVRRIVPQRLPPHETAFAVTVHKAQGSEFGRVLLLLPPIDLPLVSRELIYTGITRARGSVEIWGDRDCFAKAIRRQVVRMSGLREALWGK